MAAIDDLTELVERAVVAEKVALSSKWKERPDVAKMIDRVRKSAQQQRDDLSQDTDPLLLSSRWVSLRQDYLDLGDQEGLPGQTIDPDTPGDDLIGRARAPAEPRRRRAGRAGRRRRRRPGPDRVDRRGAGRAAGRLARIDAGEDDPDAATVDGHVPLHGKNPVSRHGPGPGPRRDRGDQVHPDPQTPDHREEPGHRPGAGPALPRLDPVRPNGTRNRSTCPTSASG